MTEPELKLECLRLALEKRDAREVSWRASPTTAAWTFEMSQGGMYATP